MKVFQYISMPWHDLSKDLWFYGMWNVDSFCGDDWLYDQKNYVAYHWTSSEHPKVFKMKPINWHPLMRENIMSLVSPD
jgi:hypothetical protein